MPNRPFRKPNSTLTARQDAFAREYLADLNGSAAARRAGYSAKTAGRQAIALLTKRHILARIEQLQRDRIAKMDIDAQWVMRRLLAELDANVADLFDENGALLPASKWPATWQRGLVTSIQTTELYGPKDKNGKPQVIGNMRNIVLADRVKRLELLGRHISVGAFRERATVGTDEPLRALFAQIAGRGVRPATEMQAIEHQTDAGAGQNEGAA